MQCQSKHSEHIEILLEHSYWFQFLNWQKIRRIGRNSKEFNYTIVTDGVTVSVEYVRLEGEQSCEEKTFKEQMEQQAQKYEQFGERYMNNEYDLIIGMDPGYKLFISAVVKDLLRDSELSVKILSTNQSTYP